MILPQPLHFLAQVVPDPLASDDTAPAFWIAFNGVVIVLLLADLFIFHRKAQAVSMRSAAVWSAFWVSLSVGFGILVWQWKGAEKGLEFFTGYVIEYSLSVDNIFIFVLIFSYFRVPPQFQYRVLFWGIMGAFIMRGTMIAIGAILIERFHWVLYIFGVFLIISGYKLLVSREEEVKIETNPILRFCRKYLPVSPHYDGQRFTTLVDGRTALTPLALVLIVVEFTDLLFAVDSIPAIFAITQDPFIVYTSNVCAILGLRSLYFLLAGLMDKFAYLKIGLGIVLSFIGFKMLLAVVYKIPTWLSLAIVVGVLSSAVGLSLLKSHREEKRLRSGKAPGSRRSRTESERKIIEAASEDGLSGSSHSVGKPPDAK